MADTDQGKDEDKRRDEVLKRMLNTKPQKHKSKSAADKPKSGRPPGKIKDR